MQPKAFDLYAKTYDDHFTNSLIGKAQREQVYKWLLKTNFVRNKNVLEINCGTGEDAQWLTQHGATVLATDISEGMISVAKKKSENATIKFKQLDCKNIGSLKPTRYNLIFSNFGGLNCLGKNELKEFQKSCSVLQNKHDHLVFVIMSSNCSWEKFYYNSKNDKLKATRRQNKNGMDTIIDGNHFKTYYYSPGDVKALFQENYQHVSTKPVGLFVPPSYLEHYVKKRKLLFGLLKFMDILFGNFSFLADRADHYLIIFEKK